MPKKKRATIPPLEVDLIPVLSCMFLLVPALLLAMEAANWASIPVSPPQFTTGAEHTDDTVVFVQKRFNPRVCPGFAPTSRDRR